MKAFHCDSCQNVVFFENIKCEKCGHSLGFLPDLLELSALEPAQNDSWVPLAPAARKRSYRRCSNGQQHEICNWLVPVEDQNPFCAACRLNQIVPDLSIPENLARWHKLELAKRRVIFTLLSLRLPIESDASENRPSLRFRFLGDSPGSPPVLTGHEGGLITIICLST